MWQTTQLGGSDPSQPAPIVRYVLYKFTPSDYLILILILILIFPQTWALALSGLSDLKSILHIAHGCFPAVWEAADQWN